MSVSSTRRARREKRSTHSHNNRGNRLTSGEPLLVPSPKCIKKPFVRNRTRTLSLTSPPRHRAQQVHNLSLSVKLLFCKIIQFTSLVHEWKVREEISVFPTPIVNTIFWAFSFDIFLLHVSFMITDTWRKSEFASLRWYRAGDYTLFMI